MLLPKQMPKPIGICDWGRDTGKLILGAFEDRQLIGMAGFMSESARKVRHLYLSLGFEVFGLGRRALKVNGTYYDEEHMVLFC